VICVAALAGSAVAQTARRPPAQAPRLRPAASAAPAPQTKPTGWDAAAGAAPATSSPPPLRILPDPSQGLDSLAAPLAPASITPIPAPQTATQCRAQCAEQRYFCATGDDSECSNRWSRCVLACGSAAPS